MAWHRPQSTVVAIGDGEVKIASVGVASWGGFVVIEHTGDKSGPFNRGGFTGYLPPAKFKSPAYGWTDPQKFIRARLE